MTLAKIKGGESETGQGETQTILSFGQLIGEFQNTDHSLEEAHVEKKWPGLAPRLLSHGLGDAPGRLRPQLKR